MKEQFLSGFVAIIGSPNVGKSTLMNALTGQKISIVSKRAQTTRNQIRGVLSRENYQIVFIDTPGIHTPKNRLGDYMVKMAYGALDEVECILYLLDPVNGLREKDEAILERLRHVKAPVLALINKIDIARPEQIEGVKARLEQESWLKGIYEISAAGGQGLSELESVLQGYLEEGPQYFPEDMVTDQPERVICAEIIREAALELLREEVPHGIGVEVEKMQDREDAPLTDVWATIYCERPGHKGIIIGKHGETLKQIGIQSRKEMEWMLGRRVNLQLWVKVRENWRNKAFDLKMLGYQEEK